MKPQRIQRKRTRGWKMPPNTVSVTRPGKWGNPYLAGMTNPDKHGRNAVMILNADLVRAFRAFALRCIEVHPRHFEPLRGKNLACWCSLDQPCHADILLELANSEPNRTGGAR